LFINGTIKAPSRDAELMMVTDKKPNPQAKTKKKKTSTKESSPQKQF